MRVKVYATLRLKIGQAEIDVKAGPGDTVRDALRELLQQYPVLAPDVMTEDGELVEHVHVFLNGRNVRLLDGLDSVIREGQRLDIFPPVGGGRFVFPLRGSCGIISVRREPWKSANNNKTAF